MDKIEKLFAVTLFTVFTAYFLHKVLILLRESNARLVTEALGLQQNYIISVTGYNEFYISVSLILIGFTGGLLATKLSQKDSNKESFKEK